MFDLQCERLMSFQDCLDNVRRKESTGKDVPYVARRETSLSGQQSHVSDFAFKNLFVPGVTAHNRLYQCRPGMSDWRVRVGRNHNVNFATVTLPQSSSTGSVDFRSAPSPLASFGMVLKRRSRCKKGRNAVPWNPSVPRRASCRCPRSIGLIICLSSYWPEFGSPLLIVSPVECLESDAIVPKRREAARSAKPETNPSNTLGQRCGSEDRRLHGYRISTLEYRIC